MQVICDGSEKINPKKFKDWPVKQSLSFLNEKYTCLPSEYGMHLELRVFMLISENPEISAFSLLV